MANDVVKFIERQDIQKRIEGLMRDRASQFITSLTSLVNTNPTLAQCKPETVINAAMKAAVLNLPIENNLGFAYIIPYKNHGVYEAQFQIGYKGYIQLAQRSSQYRTIGTAIVHEGQLIEEDPLRGNKYDWKSKTSDKVIGYVCLFALVNGFEKQLYMSREEMAVHAERYSKAYSYDLKSKTKSSPWSTDFDLMALKTVIRLLIPKYGPMSIDMKEAVQADQAILRDDERVYVDNDDLADVGASDDKKAAIVAAHKQELPDAKKSSVQPKGYRGDNGANGTGLSGEGTNQGDGGEGTKEGQPVYPADDPHPETPKESVREKAERKYIHPQEKLIEEDQKNDSNDNSGRGIAG
jgi:recombination protein RecT